MITIGLTGSIGMGKSTVAAMFADLGALTWSADDAVHRLYGPKGAAADLVDAAFPGVLTDQGIDRAVLSRKVLGDPQKLKTLEMIVHPLVAEDRAAFIKDAAHAGAAAVVLDIPLLFENASEDNFDTVVVVTAPADIQRSRVLARPGMTEEKLEAILKEQTPDAVKRKKADFVISTAVSLEETRAAVAAVYEKIIAQYSG